MSATNPTVTPNDIVLTPMQVLFTPVGGSQVDLGGTTEGVTLSIKTDMAAIMVDAYGKTTLEEKISGHHFQVKLTLAEIVDKLRIWQTAFPYMQLVTDNDGHYLGIFNMQIGASMRAVAGVLTLHPIALVASDHSQDITIDLAACQSASEVKWGPDKQTGLAVVFMVYPNTGIVPARFMRLGDTSISVTAATAGSPTAGGDNVGNGTITSVAVYNGVTVTETITLTCIGVDPTNGTIFSVVGSVSGAISPGQFTVGGTSTNTHNFVGPQISFTATQGTTKFADGDTFTIATTASNYV